MEEICHQYTCLDRNDKKKFSREKGLHNFHLGEHQGKKQKKTKQNLWLLKLYTDLTHRSDSKNILGDYSIWESEMKMSDSIKDRGVEVGILLYGTGTTHGTVSCYLKVDSL